MSQPMREYLNFLRFLRKDRSFKFITHARVVDSKVYANCTTSIMNSVTIGCLIISCLLIGVCKTQSESEISEDIQEDEEGSQTKTLACESLFGEAACNAICRLQGKRKGHCNHRRACVCKPH